MTIGVMKQVFQFFNDSGRFSMTAQNKTQTSTADMWTKICEICNIDKKESALENYRLKTCRADIFFKKGKKPVFIENEVGIEPKKQSSRASKTDATQIL